MVYKTQKRPDFGYSMELRSHIYKNKTISAEKAEKLKQKWAKQELVDNAKLDHELNEPLKLSMLNVLINCHTPRELTARNQALTYHSLKRYILCVFRFYTVEQLETSLANQKRPHWIPELNQNEIALAHGYKEELIPILAKMSLRDKTLMNLADLTGAELFTAYLDVAKQNNQLTHDIDSIYEFLKNLIITIDGHFKLKLKPGTQIKILLDKRTGLARSTLG